MITKASPVLDAKLPDQARIVQAVEILCDVYGDWPMWGLAVDLCERRCRAGGLTEQGQEHYRVTKDLEENICRTLNRRGIVQAAVTGSRTRSTKKAHPAEAKREKAVAEGGK